MMSMLLAVLSASLLAGVVNALGTGSGFEKYLRYFCALLLTLALLAPLGELKNIDTGWEEVLPEGDSAKTEQVPEQFLRRFESETEKAVLVLLEEEFSLSKKEVGVAAMAEDREGMPVLARLELTLYTVRGAALTGMVARRLEQACGCRVVITEMIRL